MPVIRLSTFQGRGLPRLRSIALGLAPAVPGSGLVCGAHEAADMAAEAKRPLIIGIAGCTASGKSTLCDALVNELGGPSAAAVLPIDNYWLPPDQLPRLPASWLAANPTMAKFKQHDTNVPAAVDFAAAEQGLQLAIVAAEHAGRGLLLVEGFLLFAQPRLVALLDRAVYLEVDGSAAQELLLHRKFTRAHLGKPSYQQRGVSLEVSF